MSAPAPSHQHWTLVLARAIGPLARVVDAVLVRLYGLESLSGSGRGCGEQGLRIRLRPLARPRTLCDTALPTGVPIVELHLCNDRDADALTRATAARWATRLLVRYRRSCRAIARRMLEDPRFADVEGVCGVTAIFGGAGGHGGAGRLPEHLGFEVLPHPVGNRVRLFFERLYAWGLMAAYTPGSLEGRRPDELSFVEVWMSRRRFLERFGPGR
ncbi:MAG: hypothetical protein P8Y02_12310 [Deinococcales bacterium]